MRSWPVSQLALRVVVALGPVVALALGGVARNGPAWWAILLVGGFSVAFALRPDGPYGSVAIVLVVGWWALGPRTAVPGVVVAAAGALVAAHVAATLVAYGPRTLPITRPLGLLWLRRGLLAFAAAPAVWLVATSLRRAPQPVDIWIAGLVVVLAGSVAGALLFPLADDTVRES
jgi:hypothetical protein